MAPIFDFFVAVLFCSASMSVLAVIYNLLMPFLAKKYSAKSRYYAWLIIIAGLIIPFRPQFENALFKVEIPESTETAITESNIISADNAEIIFESNEPNERETALNETPPNTEGEIGRFITPADNNPGEVFPFDFTAVNIWFALPIIWLFGILIFFMLNIVRHFRFIKLTRRWNEEIHEKNAVFALFDAQKKELGIKKEIRLSVCHAISSPMLVGFLKPVILLPACILMTDEEEIRFILRHELIHFKRRDVWYKGVTLVAASLHWFNPIIYMSVKSINILCEISCDDAVVFGKDENTRRRYSEIIISAAKSKSKFKTALSTNFIGGKKGMKKRILSVMDFSKKRTGLAIMCIVAVLTLGTSFAFAAAGNNGKPEARTSDVSSGTGKLLNNIEGINEMVDNSIPETGAAEIARNSGDEAAPSEKIKDFSEYEHFGLVHDKKTDRFTYKGKFVRHFWDGYEIEDGYATWYQYYEETGVVDIHTVRDVIEIEDGGIDPFGELLDIVPYSEEEFEDNDYGWSALDIPAVPSAAANADNDSGYADNITGGDVFTATEGQMTNQIKKSGFNTEKAIADASSGIELTPDEKEKLYSVYKPFGLTYDKEDDCFYFDGKLVRGFLDIMTSNGESMKSGNFKGSMRKLYNEDGEIDVETIRDYTVKDEDGYGKLTDIREVVPVTVTGEKYERAFTTQEAGAFAEYKTYGMIYDVDVDIDIVREETEEVNDEVNKVIVRDEYVENIIASLKEDIKPYGHLNLLTVDEKRGLIMYGEHPVREIFDNGGLITESLGEGFGGRDIKNGVDLTVEYEDGVPSGFKVSTEEEYAKRTAERLANVSYEWEIID